MSNLGCSCPKCKACCWRSPGWFGTIEEVEGAAKIKGFSIEEFCKEFLIREWWAGEDEEVSVPAPRRNFTRLNDDAPSFVLEEAKVNGNGFVRASWGHNLIVGAACIFLTDDERCSIHESKPTECREAFGCEIVDEDYKFRPNIVPYWKARQHLLPESDNAGRG